MEIDNFYRKVLYSLKKLYIICYRERGRKDIVLGIKSFFTKVICFLLVRLQKKQGYRFCYIESVSIANYFVKNCFVYLHIFAISEEDQGEQHKDVKKLAISREE